MRLTDRLLAAVYRMLRDAENREYQRRFRIFAESVPGQWPVTDRWVWHGVPPRPPASQDPNVGVFRGGA